MTPKRVGRGGTKRGTKRCVGKSPLRVKITPVRKYSDDSNSSSSSSALDYLSSPLPPIKSPPASTNSNLSTPSTHGSTSTNMKMTMCTAPTMVPRSSLTTTEAGHHKPHPGSPGKDVARLGAGRRPGKRVPMARHYAGKMRSMVSRRNVLDIDPDYPTNDSNDSGLGFDQHGDSHVHNLAINDRLGWPDERNDAKRHLIEVKVEHDEVNENYTFPERTNLSSYGTNMLIRTAAPSSSMVSTLSSATSNSTSSARAVPRCLPLVNRGSISTSLTLTTQLSHSSRYMDISLSILCQPEQQHRARYQTEGSRGAVKDRSGNGFPIVKLTGYNKPAILQVFIGTDLGKVAPHMFYQACRVSGKNSTPCAEKKIDGTIVIELQLEPSKDMIATCDCVGILKERNVDVEHRFPDQLANRSKKKSTRCRMVFRTYITHDDGLQETLQVCSQPIVCTQPPGIPEISKKSLTSCPATGGLELFILGKNFLKDTLVYFQLEDEDRHVRWEQSVAPDKEFLQQTHLVCVVPPFMNPETVEPCSVRLYVLSSGKCSESHQFVYTPVIVNGAMPSVRLDAATHSTVASTGSGSAAVSPFLQKILWPVSTSLPTPMATSTTNCSSNIQQDHDIGMMPPPETSMVPLSTQRRPSISSSIANANCSCPEVHSPPVVHRCVNSSKLKLELMDECSQNSLIDCPDQQQQQRLRFRHISESSMDVHQSDSNMSMVNEKSMDMLHHNGSNIIAASMNDNSNHSLINENSMDVMVRRNSFSRSYCENSMDIHNTNSMDIHTSSSMDMHNTNSNLSSSHDENSCHSVHQNNASIYSQSSMLTTGCASIIHSDLSNASIEELKVIDLRTPKLPMATVADLVSTNAPSMATLQSFGITENNNMPLQAQTVQSIENYLTNLDKNSNDKQLCNAQPQITIPMLSGAPIAENTFLTSQESLELSHVLNSVVKSESAAIAEMARQSNAVSTTSTAAMVESAILPPTTINTQRLDALVNCTVDSHINNLQRPKDLLIDNKSISMSAQDVILNAPIASLMNSVALNGPSLVQSRNSISPEIILSSQVSSSMMCRTNVDTIMGTSPAINTMCQVNSVTNNVQTNITAMLTPSLPLNNPLSLAVSEPEKAILLNAAVDLFQAQKQLNELQSKQVQLDGLLTTAVAVNNDTFTTFTNNAPISTKTMDLMPVLADQSQHNTEQQQLAEKKNEDRMIPQAFPSLSENELINIINPSCFDQGNNYQ